MTSGGPVAVAFTGASGAQYGLRLLECLAAAGCTLHVTLTRTARVVLASEADCAVPARAAEATRFFADRCRAQPGQLRVYGEEEWTSPLASGSGAPRAMVVVPCSMATLSAIACGASSTLTERAADVLLKEQGKLVLVPRETPFSAIHLENMLKLARLGVVILPANPGFYHRPAGVADMVDFVVARILDQLGIAQSMVPRWGCDPR
ncbi:MAG: Flavin prenyltransferase UbiX [Steroidobacteraceae bacterium]|nr:Flavin prenyltransferase UbiX [Steroidobacteraceae bacterium]